MCTRSTRSRTPETTQEKFWLQVEVGGCPWTSVLSGTSVTVHSERIGNTFRETPAERTSYWTLADQASNRKQSLERHEFESQTRIRTARAVHTAAIALTPGASKDPKAA